MTEAGSSSSSSSSSVSSRGLRAIKPAASYFTRYFTALPFALQLPDDPVPAKNEERDRNEKKDEDEEKNELLLDQGYVLFAVSEDRNLGALAKLREKLNTSRGKINATTAMYDNMCGRDGFRKNFAKMIYNTVIKPQRERSREEGEIRKEGEGEGEEEYQQWIDPQQLCVSAGAGAVIQHLATLLLEPGEVILLPTPTYGALYNDFTVLAQAAIENIPLDSNITSSSCSSSSSSSSSLVFSLQRLTKEALDNARERVVLSGRIPRMLFLINPNNPTGSIYTREELQLALAWCSQLTPPLHLVIDEIYANSVFNPSISTPFLSIVNLIAETSPPLASTSSRPSFLGDYVHVIYGLSKDFAISGYRCGVLYTHNSLLLQALGNVNYFSAVSFDTQDMLSEVLSDCQWTEKWLEEVRRDVFKSYQIVVETLEDLGIPYVVPQGGLFVWINLREFLPLPSEEERKKREKDGGNQGRGEAEEEEELVRELYDDYKLLFTPGLACRASSPGFFRCCFVWTTRSVLKVGMYRLRAFVLTKRNQRRLEKERGH